MLTASQHNVICWPYTSGAPSHSVQTGHGEWIKEVEERSLPSKVGTWEIDTHTSIVQSRKPALWERKWPPSKLMAEPGLLPGCLSLCSTQGYFRPRGTLCTSCTSVAWSGQEPTLSPAAAAWGQEPPSEAYCWLGIE
jgi:hypothetical protein